MIIKTISERVHSPRFVLLSTLLICLCVIGISGWQAMASQAANQVAVRERVSALMRETLSQGEGVVDGIRVSFSVPPSTKTVEEIKSYGNATVPILKEYLESENQAERDLAVKLFGSLGGRRIVIPLQKVVRYDPSSTTRMLALRSLMQAPWNLASAIIQEAAMTDTDRLVREEAQSILATHKAK